MRPVVAKLTDAEAKLLTNCLELAIEFETGGKMNQGKAEKGLRIFNLLQKLLHILYRVSHNFSLLLDCVNNLH